jgi:MFS family permease
MPSRSSVSEPKSTLPAALVPLATPVYRLLWSIWLVSNVCMWMNDVAAAWMMTSLTSSPSWVALVTTAATIPVFLLGLPSGALADTMDRRQVFLATQFWVAAVGLTLSAAVFCGVVSPPLLLALTFANGVGLAMRWPVYSAIVPEIVPRSQLPAALALNGVAMNCSRIIGPLMAGVIIAMLGSAYVFAFNAMLSVLSGIVLIRWKREHVRSALGRERFFSAMRVGVQYVAQSPRIQSVLLRTGVFFFFSTALMSLLPLVARNLTGGGAGTFTLLLATMGVGAITAAMLLPRLRQTFNRDTLVLGGTVVQALATALVALVPNPYVAAPAMLICGMAWITVANTLVVSAQLALPDWVRARGISMYQMSMMSANAIGAAIWGQIASASSVRDALLAAACMAVPMMLLAHRLIVDRELIEDLTPSDAFKAPVIDSPPVGRVVITIEYLIDALHAEEFALLMRQSRRSRLRQGALEWDLLRDVSNPGRYIERIVDRDWNEHRRRFERVTVADVALRERKLAFHVADAPPVVHRFVSCVQE